MTSLTPAAVARIAKLVRLGITDGAAAQAARDLSKVLDHFATIKTIDTDGVPTYDNATGLANVVRDDAVRSEQHCSVQTLLAAAPAVRSRHMQVKAVFGE